MVEQFGSTLELELARQKVIRADCGFLGMYYELTTRELGEFDTQGVNVDRAGIAILAALLAKHHPQLVSIYDDLGEIIDLLNDNAGLDGSNVKARLMNMLEKLKQVGKYLSVTGKRIGELKTSYSTNPPSTEHHWTDNNLLKEAYDLISEFVERV